MGVVIVVLELADAEAMANWEHGGGFSLDAGVCIEATDRQGLERLLRYCVRPAFALERSREIDADHLVYESTARLARLEARTAAGRHNSAHNYEEIIRQQSSIDQIKARIDRIERRLEIAG